MRFSLYPIHRLTSEYLDTEPFDHSVLPFQIMDGVTLEAVADRFRPDTFEWHKRKLGEDLVGILAGVEYALVHRYTPQVTIEDGEVVPEVEFYARSEQLVRNLSACLRLVRPMRQHPLMMKGIVRDED